MRGASAKSLTALESAVDATVSGGADAGELGDQLFGVVAALDMAPTLRRILTDPSTDDAAKEGLARQIFGDKVAASTLDIVAGAVKARWSSGRDLGDALEQGGVAAHVAGSDKAGELDDLEDELFRFGRVVAGDDELRGVLTDRTVPVAPKQALVETLLRDEATAPATALARQAVAARTHGFEVNLAEFGDIAAQRRERLLATVRAAYDVNDEQKLRLAAALGQQYGREVHLNVIVDPSVIGGISVSIGDEIIDGTVSSKLEDARRRIAG